MKLSLLLCLLLAVLADPPPLSTPNPNSIITKTYTIPTSNQRQSTDPEWTSNNYTLNYDQSINSSNVLAVLSFGELSLDYSYARIQVSMFLVDVGQTHANISVDSTIYSLVRKMSVRIFIASGVFADSSKMVAGETEVNPKQNISKTKSFSTSIDFPATLISSKSVTIFGTLTGFTLSATSYPYLDLNLQMSRSINQTNITLTSRSSKPTYVQAIRINFLIFDQQFASSHGMFTVTAVKFETPKSKNYYTLAKQLQSSRQIYGITGFAFSSGYDFGYKFVDDKSDRISLQTKTSFSYFNFYILSANIQPANKSGCSEDTPGCQNKCQPRYYQNTISRSCQPCPYDCYTCNSNRQCLSCDVMSDHRNLDTSSMRCVPWMGYYESQRGVAGKCREGCKTCSNAETCLSCKANYTMDSTKQCVIQSTNVQDNNNKTALILKISVTLASCLLVLITVFIVYRRCKSKRSSRVQAEGASNAALQPDPPRPSLYLTNNSLVDNMKLPYKVSEWMQMSPGFEYEVQLQCSIDLDKKPFFRLGCGHYFHLPCLLAWKSKSSTCPVCRSQIGEVGHLHCEGCVRRYKQVNYRSDLSRQRISERRFKFCDECA